MPNQQALAGLKTSFRRMIAQPDELGFLGVVNNGTFPGAPELDGYIYDIPYKPGYTYARIQGGAQVEVAEVLAGNAPHDHDLQLGFDRRGGALVLQGVNALAGVALYGSDLPNAYVAPHTLDAHLPATDDVDFNGQALVGGGLAAFAGIVTTASGRVRQVRVVTAAGAVTVTTADDIVVVNKTSGAATTVNLPATPTTGQTFVIHDGKGDAATNNITITPAAGNINGAGTLVIAANYGTAVITYNGTQWDAQVGGAGGGAFTALTDVPASYAGAALQLVRVNAGGTALEFVAPVGGDAEILTVVTATVGNVGTGVDNLMSYAVPADTLAVDGDALEFWLAGVTAANGNNKRIIAVFGATTLIDTTALALNGVAWRIHGKVWRTGAATQKAICTFTSASALLPTLTTYSEPGETLSGAVTLKATGEATSDNDIEQETFDVVRWIASGASSALANVSSYLSSDVTMTNADQFYDAVSVALGVGTWKLDGYVLPKVLSTNGGYTAKLWDGTTTYSAGYTANIATLQVSGIAISGIVTLASPTTLKISVACTGAGNAISAAPITNSPGNYATYLHAVKIG